MVYYSDFLCSSFTSFFFPTLQIIPASLDICTVQAIKPLDFSFFTLLSQASNSEVMKSKKIFVMSFVCNDPFIIQGKATTVAAVFYIL